MGAEVCIEKSSVRDSGIQPYTTRKVPPVLLHSYSLEVRYAKAHTADMRLGILF